MSTTTVRKKRKFLDESTIKKLKRYRILYLFIIPPMIAVLIFHYIPFYGIIMAFQNFKPSLGFLESEWVGFTNFIKFFKYPYFGRMIRNTLVLSLLGFTTFPLPIIFTIMLNELKSSKLKRTCQTITYAPHFVSTVVVCSMTLLFIQQDGGVLNIIIEFLGGEAKEWISYPSAFPFIYVISGLWSTLGWSTIIYMSSLASVPMENVEAARIDGAGRFAVIWHIYLPHLKPTIIILLIMNMGGILSTNFEKIYLLQNPLNTEISSVLSTYSYQMGIIGGQYSYSAAIGLFNNVVNVILVILANTISKKLSEDKIGLW